MVTIVDVARLACVTPSTVSNVITGRVAVSKKTRERVLAAIDELGYHPNLVARGLVQKRTNTIGLVMYSIAANPVYSEIFEEFEFVINGQNYQILLCNTRDTDDQARKRVEDLVDRRVDGLMIMGGSLQLHHAEQIAKRGLPIVLSMWDADHPDVPLPSVDIDFRYGAELSARHLVALGHRRFAVLHHTTHMRHLESFRTVLHMAGLPEPISRICSATDVSEAAYETMQDILVLPPAERPTGIYATTDAIAIGVVEAACDLGLRVPQDLSVIGMDNIRMGRHMRPSLTTIDMPKHVLAQETVELLFRYIGNAKLQPYQLVIRPHLIVRQSTGPAPSQ